MKRFFFLASVALLPYLSIGQTLQWAKSMGGAGGDYGSSIAVDAEGNVYTTGGFQGTADFDPGTGTVNLITTGDADIFISKIDASGNFVWAKAIGGTSRDQAYSIAVDGSGNVYTAGSFQGTVDFDPGAGIFPLISSGGNDIFISKLDANGNFVWAKSMGGTGREVGYFLALDAVGNVYTTGEYTDTVDFDPGSGTFTLTSEGISDIFVSKLDANGNFAWAKSMGGLNEFTVSYCIALDEAGNVYTTGKFKGTGDFDPGAGVFTLTSAGDNDIFISKLDINGNFVWAKAIGGALADLSNSLAVDAAGNVYTTGVFRGTSDFDPGASVFNLTAAGDGGIFLSKLDANGDFVWAKAMVGTVYGFGYSLALDPAGNVFTTGYFEGTIDFDPGAGTFNLTPVGLYDVFISKLDPDGNFVWAKSMGGAADELSYSIALDGAGNIYTTGEFIGTSDFDPDSATFNLTSAGSSDVFIHKMSNPRTSLEGLTDMFPLSVFPNPSTGHFTLEGEQAQALPLRISVFNAMGQQIRPKEELAPATQWTHTIDLSTQPNGIYHLRISDGSGSISRQLVVQR